MNSDFSKRQLFLFQIKCISLRDKFHEIKGLRKVTKHIGQNHR